MVNRAATDVRESLIAHPSTEWAVNYRSSSFALLHRPRTRVAVHRLPFSARAADADVESAVDVRDLSVIPLAGDHQKAARYRFRSDGTRNGAFSSRLENLAEAADACCARSCGPARCRVPESPWGRVCADRRTPKLEDRFRKPSRCVLQRALCTQVSGVSRGTAPFHHRSAPSPCRKTVSSRRGRQKTGFPR